MVQSALFEHRFWLQILGDHARFIFNTLSPVEKQDIEMAASYIEAFDRLLEAARNIQSETELRALATQSHRLTENFRSFKLDLLSRAILGKVKIGLTPTFINHMVNELEEYLRILNELVQGKAVPNFDALHHDFLWLPDAAGHAAAIASDLDSVENRLIAQSEKFKKHFDHLYMKSIEMAGYMRTNLKDFPAFRRLHKEVDIEIKLFVAFLNELEEMEFSAEVLDRISPLMPDHMMREECYYLTKLAQLGLASTSDCQADKPRVEM
jgi:hypothetical protein